MSVTLAPAEGPAAWFGPQIDYRVEGMHVLSAGEIAEIDAALAHLHSLGPLDFPDITPEKFPLPTLGGYFASLGEELRHGRGFLLLRGLPRERYSLDDIGLVYYGIGVHLGRPVAQSYQGELLGNVIDVSDVEAQARGYHAGGGQRMHSDNCDVVALMCVRAARAGGISRIVSAAAVHNRLLETRPDLLEALCGEWVFRRMELDAQYGTGPLTKRVVIFSRESGQLTCNVSGSYPYRAAKAGDWVMSSTQIEALDEMARIAASPELYLDMSIGEGDIQFLNNRTILHGRTDYEDSREIATRRHMLRLWLQMPTWPPLPANQGMQSPADYPLWQRQRTPFMEVPTRYLAEMTRRKAELAA
ncbi:MAG TPA: TauD/TfdA family dioxygenase [Stellaceae bacterium]|nr:TauD/TfdA family dioxygenase [Stellaceae bacterium]